MLRVKALEKRVNTTRETHAQIQGQGEGREMKKQRVEIKRREPVFTPRRGEEDGDSTVVSIVPPSTIRRMLGYVWRGDSTLDSIDSGDAEEREEDESPLKSPQQLVSSAPETSRPVENKLLTRLREIRDAPVKSSSSASTSSSSSSAPDFATPMKQVPAGTNPTPAHPASPAWSPALPGKWTFSNHASSGSNSMRQPSTPAHSVLAGPGLASSGSWSTPKLYPSLNPPLTQRSSALKALFDTPQTKRVGAPQRSVNTPSVLDMVRTFEEDGLLGRNLEREGLRRSQSRGD